MKAGSWPKIAAFLLLLVFALGTTGCDEAAKLLKSKVSGKVVNAKGEPVEGANVKLFNLTDNTNFVVGADIQSASGEIDPVAVATGTNTTGEMATLADGTFEFTKLPNVFLATASKDGCTLDVQGFNDETGILNLDTPIKPSFLRPTLTF